jgi:LAO/AO transport system kinase
MTNGSIRYKSALQVNKGIEPPPIISPDAFTNKKKKKKYTVQEYVDGITSGSRTILSQAITLIESNIAEHNEMGRDIIEKCLPLSSKSLRIGVTGVPGVGKSTFIESLGNYIISKNHKLAVLAVDPSSERSKGSILGDRTRMEKLSSNNNVYIRPSPSAGSLGGVARKTRETIILVEAAGFDTVIVETVGVGQSETSVHSMVDIFLLLMLAGAGDELQGIKRGVMEMADILVINKADGENKQKAEAAKAEYSSALQLFPPSNSGWKPVSITASALMNTGISELWNMIEDYIKLTTKQNNYFNIHRKEQSKFWMYETINEALIKRFYNNENIEKLIPELETQVIENKISPFNAASKLLKISY